MAGLIVAGAPWWTPSDPRMDGELLNQLATQIAKEVSGPDFDCESILLKDGGVYARAVRSWAGDLEDSERKALDLLVAARRLTTREEPSTSDFVRYVKEVSRTMEDRRAIHYLKEKESFEDVVRSVANSF